VVMSSAIQQPWVQNECKQFPQPLVTFSNKTEHRTLTFLEKFFFPCCDLKSDSEVHHRTIQQKCWPIHTLILHLRIWWLYLLDLDTMCVCKAAVKQIHIYWELYMNVYELPDNIISSLHYPEPNNNIRKQRTEHCQTEYCIKRCKYS
jgi:hypothetical protein